MLTSGSSFQFPPLLVFIIPGQVGNRYPGSFCYVLLRLFPKWLRPTRKADSLMGQTLQETRGRGSLVLWKDILKNTKKNATVYYSLSF